MMNYKISIILSIVSFVISGYFYHTGWGIVGLIMTVPGLIMFLVSIIGMMRSRGYNPNGVRHGSSVIGAGQAIPGGHRQKYLNKPPVESVKNTTSYDGKFILLDTSVVLDVIGFNEEASANSVFAKFVVDNPSSVGMVDTVKREVDGIVRNNKSRYISNKKILNRGILNVGDYKSELDKVDAIYQSAVRNMAHPTSQEWIHSKRRYIEKEFNRQIDPMNLDVTERSGILPKLYKDAGSDIEIVAKAVKLSRNIPVILLSYDGDILSFADDVSKICESRIKILKPRAIGLNDSPRNV